MVKKSELKLDSKFYDISRWGNYSRADTIQGGHYRLEKGFDRGHYLYLYNLKKRIYLKIVEESFPKKVPKCVKTSSSEIALVLSFVSNHERKPF